MSHPTDSSPFVTSTVLRFPGSETDTTRLQDRAAEVKRSLRKIEYDVEQSKQFTWKNVDKSIINRPLDFEKGDTSKQIIMRHAWTKLARSISLSQYLQKLVDDNSNSGHASTVYRHIRGPENRRRLSNLINCVPDGMILAMIDGNIAWKYNHNPEFRSVALELHHLSKHPGQYVMQLARSPTTMQGAQHTRGEIASRISPDEHAGCWLSPLEIVQYVEAAKKYLVDADFARQVDYFFGDVREHHFINDYRYDWFGPPSGHPTAQPQMNPPYRRYYRADSTIAKEWIQAMEEMYVQRIDIMIAQDRNDPRLQKPLQWGPLEIGYGIDVQTRADAHSDHHASNKLFVWQNALLRKLFDPTQTKYMVYKFEVNRLPHPGSEAFKDANTSDVAMTLIANSYWFDGGANPDYAAGGGVNEQKLGSKEAVLQKSFDMIYETASFYRSNLMRDELAIATWKKHNTLEPIADKEELANTDAKDVLSKNIKGTLDSLEEVKDGALDVEWDELEATL